MLITEGSKYAYLVKGVRKLDPGEAMLATQGEDFTCTIDTFRSTLYRVAVTKGRTWHATSVVVGTSVVYAFYQTGDYLRPNLPAYPIVKALRGER